jgi:hypothetical protein
MVAMKLAAVYFAFGIAHTIVYIAYCNYRAHAGNPSDLPCVSLLWTPMDLGGWPLMALSDAVNGYAVLVPTFWVRTIGIAFLTGFIATLAWVFRNPPRSTS